MKFNIPTWSLNYIINGDTKGLTDIEIGIINEFVEENELKYNLKHEFFCWHPEFGPACTCVEAEEIDRW